MRRSRSYRNNKVNWYRDPKLHKSQKRNASKLERQDTKAEIREIYDEYFEDDLVKSKLWL